jgi:uncharacterized protein YjdB
VDKKTVISGLLVILTVTLAGMPEAMARSEYLNTMESVNQPPLAYFTYSPSNPVANEAVTFDASPSYDPDGYIASYWWNISGNMFTTKIVNFSFPEPGTYYATLVVTDNNGSINSTYKEINVAPAPPVLTTITISPANASVPVGGNATFTADTRDQYGNPIPATVTWTSSNTTVGYISGNIDGTGWFHGFALGTTTITATNGSVSGSTVVTVTEPAPPELFRIVVLPYDVSVVAGSTQTFTAYPEDQYGNPFPTTVTWSSSNTAVGTIDSNGLFTAIAAGTTTITASSGSVSGTATATVTLPPPVLTTITVSPATASVVAGSTQTFTADTRDQYGNPFPTTVTWSSSNTAVGTIDSNGLFTAIAAGTTTITASSGSVSGTATATVRLPTVTFVVTNSVTNSPVTGASVLMDGVKIITDATGKAVFTNIAPGDHSYAVSKTGYRRATGSVGVTADTTVPVKLVPK